MNVDVLNKIIDALPMILPESILVLTIVFLTLLSISPWKKNNGWSILCCWIGGIAYLLAAFYQLGESFNIGFSGMISLNDFAIYGKLLIGGLYLCVLHLSAIHVTGHNNQHHEYWILTVAILLGGSTLLMSESLLMIYLAVELLSFSAYGLTAFNQHKEGQQSAIKYLLFGAVASAMTVYGMSLLYGLTGTLSLSNPQFWLHLTDVPTPILAFAVFLATCGLLFKITAVPLHPWVDDVYQHAPTPVAAFFSTLPKIAVFFCLVNLVQILQPFNALNSPSLTLLIGIVAIMSMTIGNLLALWQKDVKRMLAYSSVSHAGFLLAIAAIPNKAAWDAGLFYVVVYGIMNLAAFGMVQYFETRKLAVTYADFNGLGKKLPLWGIGLVIVMISLTGLPPTAGFNAKLMVFIAFWEQFERSGMNIYLYLLIAGVLNTVIALFYYIKLPYHFYFQKQLPEDDDYEERRLNVITTPLRWSYGIITIILIIPLLVLFFAPQIIL
ncbi:NADH-quinone oxidoreductase subunit N [Persicobacter psychrovividus]|uniref:NADH-quinone oxidoreductase subunit N n=1 Tax=Persicobacter psychrovividus TaxID=387638 RepID=A0ABM7VFC6_9BACT|nr:NADH-quinone oxidoreductase subunit N [Persicobacter psychrovividus]